MKSRQRLPAPVFLAVSIVLAVAIIAGVIVFSRRQATAPEPTATPGVAVSPSTNPAAFLTVDGRRFSYRGQPVMLHGVNFNNEPALTGSDGDPKGADIDKINVNEADYAKLHSWGGNVVRWGMAYTWYANDKQKFFQVMDQHVGWARENHLWMIPVLYEDPGGGGDFNQPTLWGNQENEGKLIAFWQEVAKRYASQPTVAGYDMVNEPNPPSPDAWQSLGQRIHDAIAKVAPYQFVAYEDMKHGTLLPLAGGNIVYSVHNYPNGDNYPEVPQDVPLWVGEFGTKHDPKWAQHEIQRYANDGVHWSYFVWREDSGDYGLFAGMNSPGDFAQPNQPLIDVVRAGMAGSVQPS
jgi:hypothetical protein